MPRTLRTQTGCLRCRRRRIKCDELKPICAFCAKAGYLCLWPSASGDFRIIQSQKLLANTHTALSTQLKFGTICLPSLIRVREETDPAIPRPVSPCGHQPLHSEQEDRLLEILSAYLVSSTSSHVPLTNRALTHEFSVALQEPWVRAPLFALGALIAVARGNISHTEAYERYDVAIKTVQKKFLKRDTREEKEQLLIAIVFMSMLEVSAIRVLVLACSCVYDKF